MVVIIAHRGNIFGRNKERENSPLYIIEAINYGYNVEIDVWLKDGNLYLGHDEPIYKIDIEFLRDDKIWVHCKNLECLYYLLSEDIHCFFHQDDDATLTSRNFIWLYPGKKLENKRSIIVLPENNDYKYNELIRVYGICTDKSDYYNHKLNI